jgi:hypothetical protein
MRSITRNFLDTGSDYSLSPELWLSTEASRKLAAGIRLEELVDVISKQSAPPIDARFVLDTGHAREGLLDLPILGNAESGRTSQKKIAEEGDVIISRLRPYLRQVALLPYGTKKTLGIDRFYLSTEFIVLRRKDGKDAGGLVAWLLSPPIQAMMSDAATGGHHPRINVELLTSASVEEKYLEPKFSSAVSSVLTRHLEGQRELSVLLGH